MREKDKSLWKLICIETRVPTLLKWADRQARYYKKHPDKRCCATEMSIKVIVPWLNTMVGWYAPEDALPELRTVDAWEVAFFELYDHLPPCNNCNCL